jgi:hypothetical protein
MCRVTCDILNPKVELASAGLFAGPVIFCKQAGPSVYNGSLDIPLLPLNNHQRVVS